MKIYDVRSMPEVKEALDTYKAVQDAYLIYLQTMGIRPQHKQITVNSANISMNKIKVSTAGALHV
ncbi:hypothetical protein [Treponema pedis]|uniref:hypothetical protein n=1 Tax=Treponema pedis TaxID=409322 RepID=UPI003D1EB7AB